MWSQTCGLYCVGSKKKTSSVHLVNKRSFQCRYIALHHRKHVQRFALFKDGHILMFNPPLLTNSSLQVFQKCIVKEVGLKGLVEPQIRELRPGALQPFKDKKVKDIMSFNRPLNCLPVPAACPWWLSFTMLVWLSYPPLTSSEHSCDGNLTPEMFSLFFHLNSVSFLCFLLNSWSLLTVQ